MSHSSRIRHSQPTPDFDPDPSGNQTTRFRFQYLYHNRFEAGAGFPIAAHSHPFWQLEIVTQGELETFTGSHSRRMAPGEIILLPPRLPHAFIYRASGTRVFSLKFRFEGDVSPESPVHAAPDTFTTGILQALEAMLGTNPESDPQSLAVVEHLLASLVLRMLNPPAPRQEFSQVARVKRIAEELDGRPLAVSAIARKLRISAAHLRAEFLRIEHVPLKRWIDRHRLDAVLRYLAHSDIPLKELSARLGFCDPAGFSRFIRRMSGFSPRRYRESIRKGTNLESSRTPPEIDHQRHAGAPTLSRFSRG